MDTAVPTYAQRRYSRETRPVPRGEVLKVVLALVLNTILFALVVL